MVINDPQTVAEVSAAFARYEAALIEPDAAALDELFWDSPFTIRYGAGEALHGHAAIQAFNATRPPLRDRRLDKTVITTFGRDFATVSTLFLDASPGKIGRQQQSWARAPEGWRVVAAHVSVLDQHERER